MTARRSYFSPFLSFLSLFVRSSINESEHKPKEETRTTAATTMKKKEKKKEKKKKKKTKNSDNSM